MSESIFQLIINPKYKDEHNHSEVNKKQLQKMESSLTKLGKVKGWEGNPRWDLLFEEGFKVLVNKK